MNWKTKEPHIVTISGMPAICASPALAEDLKQIGKTLRHQHPNVKFEVIEFTGVSKLP